MRGRQRIAFFCSEYIYTFLDKYGITPFNEVTSSDHRGLFLDLKLKTFLKTPTFPFLAIPSVPLNLQTPKVSSVTKKLRNYVTEHNIIKQAAVLPKELLNNNITHEDYNSINELNELLTKGMIKAEKMITKYGP